MRGFPGKAVGSRIAYGALLLVLVAQWVPLFGDTNSPVITLNPAKAAAATNGLRDIRGPVDIPTGWTWFRRIVVPLLVLALLWWAWRAWRKKRQEKDPEAWISPQDRARAKLREAWVLLEQPEPFVNAVSEAVRTYLEERFGLKAPERTTEEFLSELQRSAMLDLRHKQVLEDFLSRCDLVKFARYEPQRQELEDLHNSAMRLVDETTAPSFLRPPVPPGMSSPTSLTSTPAPTLLEPTLLGDERYQPRPRPESGTTANPSNGTPT
jgi:hypothetical protein